MRRKPAGESAFRTCQDRTSSNISPLRPARALVPGARCPSRASLPIVSFESNRPKTLKSLARPIRRSGQAGKTKNSECADPGPPRSDARCNEPKNLAHSLQSIRSRDSSQIEPVSDRHSTYTALESPIAKDVPHTDARWKHPQRNRHGRIVTPPVPRRLRGRMRRPDPFPQESRPSH